MAVDHTGEKYGNKLITGPGSWREAPRWNGYGTPQRVRARLYRWQCTECGATGEARMGVIKRYPHICQKAPVIKDEPCVCTRQCRGCGHYRNIGNGACPCCHFFIDTGRLRPKVDLRKEPCPVRSPGFRAGENEDTY